MVGMQRKKRNLVVVRNKSSSMQKASWRQTMAMPCMRAKMRTKQTLMTNTTKTISLEKVRGVCGGHSAVQRCGGTVVCPVVSGASFLRLGSTRGANGLVAPRDFLVPTAWFEDKSYPGFCCSSRCFSLQCVCLAW
ncbi:uncharacterized protein LOC124834005 isoform X2 [Vigna umbellata]|uniref:uncharacterized protein LOC124834005 isoform X2 n=1 Tax=Vigna umbellata TaxID=87088 RepID=UPI001F5F6111|nr:uncharacterized protein LOC124834005 isoform X2 [Vigna umbellata]